MADLPIEGKVIPGVFKSTMERKPEDKPQEASQGVQVHQGNIGVLQVKLLECINNGVQDIRKMIKEMKDKNNG